MTFWLISNNEKRSIQLSAARQQAFRSAAIEITMFYVGKGEAILISRGNRAILIDGGAGTGRDKNDALGEELAKRITPGTLRAIVATHPHRDHTNFHHILTTTKYADRFASSAEYFDNGTSFAGSNWTRLKNWEPNLPFERHAINATPGNDSKDRVYGLGKNHLLRAKGAKSRPKYWSVFMLLRFKKARMLFTGDAYKSYENRLLPRLEALTSRVHLLKVTHHGSKDGTSPKLVASLRPAIAIASTDAAGTHSLEKKVRDRLEQQQTTIYTTYDRTRPSQQKRKDIIVRTDGTTRKKGTFKGVLFEVQTRAPVLSQ